MGKLSKTRGARRGGNAHPQPHPPPVQAMQPAMMQPAMMQPAMTQPASGGDKIAKLQQLAQLKDAGLLTQEEFEQQKAVVLSGSDAVAIQPVAASMPMQVQPVQAKKASDAVAIQPVAAGMPMQVQPVQAKKALKDLERDYPNLPDAWLKMVCINRIRRELRRDEEVPAGAPDSYTA